MSNVEFSTKAYCKMIMHAAKYPHCAVNGLLLSERSKLHQEFGTQTFVDCIPLFHISLGLTPMAEIALMQVDQYCKTSGLVITGYYQANENIKDNSPNFVALKTIEKIAEQTTDACLVMINNHQLSYYMTEPAIVVSLFNDGKWRPMEETSVQFENDDLTLTAAASLIQNKIYRHLVDFDNHLDDISVDWRNPAVEEDIIVCSNKE